MIDFKNFQYPDRIAVNLYTLKGGIHTFIILADLAGNGYNAGSWTTPAFIYTPDTKEEYEALIDLINQYGGFKEK